MSDRAGWGPLTGPRRRDPRRWRHALLLLLTLLTTSIAGADHYYSFVLGFSPDSTAVTAIAQLSWLELLLPGAWYALTILAILGCHEMGHYVACRFYRVDASPPYFLPAPPPVMTGTFGAFIRIRSRMPSRIALFDIGIAGPLAGFVVAVPALTLGLLLSRVERLPDSFEGMWLGEPLLFQFASWLIIGPVADGYSVHMHPVAFAAWFGLIATALNLFPVGQLDGGHISYAVLGRYAVYVTFAMVAVAIGLAVLSLSWLVWTGLLLLMLFFVGPHHPPTLDDEVPLGRTRLVLAGVALVLLIVCFTPVPIEPFVGLD